MATMGSQSFADRGGGKEAYLFSGHVAATLVVETGSQKRLPPFPRQQLLSPVLPPSPIPQSLVRDLDSPGRVTVGLHTVLPGCEYEVVAVDGEDALSQRLLASGVWAGAVVERIASAPFGDPVLFRLHGYRLALRRAEAERVQVVACAPAPDSLGSQDPLGS